MILKQLELNGFKSFVDPTRLDFTNGFTAVVGPNGCGKSNLSDAIRWVIGEQSSKSLRGTKITDLIFNGSAGRKPVNRTEISMTLSDVPAGLKIANVPNLSDEIKVTRCYHRSGESEFYINQIPCRLKDITDLFLDVGISPKVLTVIEQGHIQDIVTSKAEDRRIWIEEAAGVLKFKQRRNEALRKLESSGQNLDRISDIVQELGRQANSLKRQAAKAERFREYQGEIKELSLRLFSQKVRRGEKELGELDEEFNRQNEQKTQWGARSSTLENQITQMKIDLDGLYTSLNEKKETVHELSNQISQNEHNIDLRRSQIEQAEKDIEASINEVQQMSDEIESLGKECESRKAELESVSQDIQAKEKILEMQERDLTRHKEELSSLDEQVQSVEKRVLEFYHQISQKKNNGAGLDTQKQYLEERDGKLAREQEEVAVQMQSARSAVTDAEKDYGQKSQNCEKLKAELTVLEGDVSSTRDNLKAVEEKVLSSREIYLNQSSLLNSLTELRKKLEGFGEGVKALMGTTNGNRLAGLREVLVDVLKAPAEYETAIEAVMGEKLQSVIVNSYGDTVEAINYLKDHKSGRGSFIPLKPKSSPQVPLHINGNKGIVGKAVDLVETRDEYRSVIEHLLGQVVVVSDFDTALQLHGHDDFQGTVVTLNGEVIDSQGMVSGGAEQDNQTGLLTKNRELESLAVKVDDLQKELKELQAEYDRQSEELKTLEDKFQSTASALHESEIVRNNSGKDLEQLNGELRRLEQKNSTLSYERSSGEHELEEVKNQLEGLDGEIKTAEEEKSQAEESLTALKGQLAAKRLELDQRSEEVSSGKILITSLQGKHENILSEIKRIDLYQENLRHKIERSKKDRGSNAEKIDECKAAIESFEKEILEQAREKDEVSEEVVTSEELLKEKEETLEQTDQESKTLSKKIQDITEEISRLELKRSETRMQTSHLVEKAFEDFNVAREEMLNSYVDEVDEGEVSAQLAELKDKVAKLGDVNLAALSEYHQTNERYTFLVRQQEDLTESIRLLHETIEKMNRATRQMFVDTFEKVNEHFMTIFSRLFEGGKAEMTLCDPDNPLESGIDISASPLGKKMHHLSLLSGGEKTMAAIALIFAILKVRPSPFCLLDEVDAPLDEANVIRFQEMLKEMADKTQFIIITHNQRTMTFADTLYGVTMEERGVSKIVSVNLN